MFSRAISNPAPGAPNRSMNRTAQSAMPVSCVVDWSVASSISGFPFVRSRTKRQWYWRSSYQEVEGPALFVMCPTGTLGADRSQHAESSSQMLEPRDSDVLHDAGC